MSATYTVGDGKTYATPQAAFAAIVAALSGDISGQGVHTIEVYAKAAGYADGAIDLSTGLVGQSATDYVEMVAMVSHGGDRDAGIVLDVGSVTVDDRINLGDYTRFHGFCLTATSFKNATVAIRMIASLADFTKIYDNIIYDAKCTIDSSVYGIRLGGEGCEVWNNQVFHIGPDAHDHGRAIYADGGTIGNPNQIHNNTVVGPTVGADQLMGYGIQTVAGSYNDVRNNVSMNCTSQDYRRDSVLGTFEHNISSDATAGAADGCLSSKVSANQFVSVANGSEDYHLLVGADCNKNGSDLSALFTDDCRGYTRDPAGFNTGAFEYEDYVPAADLDTLIQPAMLGAIASGH